MPKFKKSIGIFFERTIGDLIYTSSIVSSIRKNEPESHIHVVTSECGLEILNSDIPDYDKISTKFDSLIRYDIVYYPLRCAQCLPHWNRYNLHIRDLAADSIGVKLSNKYSNIVKPREENISNDSITNIANERYIIINNRASSDRFKEVNIEVMSELVNKINKDYRVIQLGLSQDPPIANSDLSFLGTTSIIETLYLIRNANMVFSIDNFFSHASSAYNTPFVGSYGFYDFGQVGPIDINRSDHYRIINKGTFGDYNMKGCSEITIDDLYKNYIELKGELGE